VRISTSQQFASLKQQIMDAQERVDLYQTRMSTGIRVSKPSDDPFAALGILTLSSAKSKSDQHQSTATAASNNLKMAEARLGEMTDVMQQAKTIVIQGANGATDQQGRIALAAQIDALQQRLVQSANGQDGSGHYLFAGYKVTTKPFVPDSSVVNNYIRYDGDQGKQIVEAGPGTLLQSNMLIDQQVTDAYNALEDAKQRLQAGDASGLSGVTLQKIDDAAANLLNTRGEAGVMIQQFDDAAAAATRRSDEFTKQISDKQDADLIDTVTNLQRAQTAYQASLAALTVANGLTLLDYLKP